jgi:hypothetical protein
MGKGNYVFRAKYLILIVHIGFWALSLSSVALGIFLPIVRHNKKYIYSLNTHHIL